MSDYRKSYEYWMSSPIFDESTKTELAALSDEKEIEDRFYRDLEFGTGGARGIMGAGRNRMNIYNIRRITAGFANYLIKEFGEEAKTRGVAVAFDSRHNSETFAKATALTFAAYGIPAKLYTMISATPLLSFTVRYFGCVGGVVVTASHNTREYNGYKAYDQTGCQLYPTAADKLMAEVDNIKLENVKTISEDEALSRGLLTFLGEEVMREFIEAVKEQAHPLSAKAKANLKIVYTPLHGAGNVPVRTVLEEMGFSDVNVVKEQELPDGNFPTVKSPNPGDESALELAKKLAEKIGADLIVASDPDADRIGMAARCKDGTYCFYTGNQICAMLINYILLRRKNRLSAKSALITTVVTSEFGSAIAKKYGLSVLTVLTGFKFIGEMQTRVQDAGQYKVEFGYEESNGCLIGDYARDKDSVSAIMMMCEMAAYFKEQGKDMAYVLDDLYKEYGYYLDVLDSLVLPGKDGAEKIRAINEKLRAIGKNLDSEITEIKDYATGIDGNPPSDVLKYWYKDGSWMAIRPSGTEPKIKVYYCIHNNDKVSAEKSLERMRKSIKDVIDSI